MPTRHIPSKESRRWSGPYLGNYYGNLWKTFNVDLDRSEGKIALSQRTYRTVDSADLSSLGPSPVQAFIRTNADCEDRYWALTDTDLYKTDSAATPNSGGDWDTDGVANSPNSNRDFAVIGNDSRNDSGRNQLFVTMDTDIAVLNDTGNNAWTANWWTGVHSQRPLDSNATFHPIEYFPFRKIGLVGDGNLIHTISRPSDTQNDTVSYARLTLPLEFEVRHIFTTTNRAWFLCRNKTREGAVFEWDGFSETYNNVHKIGSAVPLTGINYNEVPIILNSNGLFLEYDGNGFSPMVRNGETVALPIFDGLPLFTSTNTDSSFPLYAYPRGIAKAEDNLIYINLNTSNTPPYPRFGAGIWCLNPQTGRLYNKHSLSQDTSDFGSQILHKPGAIFFAPLSETITPMLLGGSVITSSGAIHGGIWIVQNNDNGEQTRGYFITQFIPANEVREFWDSLWIRFSAFRGTGASLVVKARGVRPLRAGNGQTVVSSTSLTWTSASTYTTTLSSTSDALAVGDEVEITSGANAGLLAHITTISGAHGALQTITIDETANTASGTSSAIYDRWKKLGVISDATFYEASLPIGIDSSFIQFKVEVRGGTSATEVSDLIINSETSIYNKK